MKEKKQWKIVGKGGRCEDFDEKYRKSVPNEKSAAFNRE